MTKKELLKILEPLPDDTILMKRYIISIMGFNQENEEVIEEVFLEKGIAILD